MLGLVLVGLGTWALLAALDVDVSGMVAAAVLLVLAGTGLVVSAVRGEARSGWTGVVAVGAVVLALLAVVVSDVGWIGGSVGDARYTPTAVTDLEDDYALLAGSLVLDLRGLDVPVGTTHVRASALAGEVVVHVPDDVRVVIDTDVGAGQSTVLGTTRDGLGVDNDRVVGTGGRGQRLVVDVSVAVGEIRVTE